MWNSSVNYVPCFQYFTGLQGPRYCSQPLWGTPGKTRPRQSLSHFCECVNCLKYTFPYHCKSSLKVWKLFYLSLSLYFWSVILHCSCSVSSASHFLWHCLQTNCDVAGVEQKQFQILRGIFTRWVRLVGGGFCNKANLLSFTSTSNDHNRHESVNFSA